MSVFGNVFYGLFRESGKKGMELRILLILIELMVYVVRMPFFHLEFFYYYFRVCYVKIKKFYCVKLKCWLLYVSYVY